MYALAACFLSHFVLVVASRFSEPQGMGIRNGFASGGVTVQAVSPDSPAARAGIQPGDRVVAVDAQSIADRYHWWLVGMTNELDRPRRLQIERTGDKREVMLTLGRRPWSFWWSKTGLLNLIFLGSQSTYLALALFIAFRRPHDAVARIGALALAGAPSALVWWQAGTFAIWRQLPGPLAFFLAIPRLAGMAVAPTALAFLALFPRRLFRARWVWTLVWAPALLLLPWDAYYHVYCLIYRPERAVAVSPGCRLGA